MTLAVPIGESDFRLLRAAGAHYVDKSGFVRDVLANPAKVMLFLRPRRFGKTLNLSMLRWFLEAETSGVRDDSIRSAFEGLEIWDVEGARASFRKHPVIWLTFKDVKANNYERIEQRLITQIAAEIRRHVELGTSGALQAIDRGLFERLGAGLANSAEYESSMLFLS